MYWVYGLRGDQESHELDEDSTFKYIPEMCSKKVPNMLHAVTLIRSGIGRPYWQKRTLQALGLTKMHKPIIHKNTASVNAMLASVKELIKVEPIYFRTDLQNSPSGGEFMLDNGQVFIDPSEIPSDIIQTQEVRHDKQFKKTKRASDSVK